VACEKLEYGRMAEELEANLAGQRAPLNAVIGLTERCNLGCVHCFIHDPSQDRMLRDRELGTEQWFKIFDQLAAAGCLWMLWTGGEILVRRDFVELYRYAKRKGFLITLFTNGTLLTPELVELLEAWYPNAVEITLYGLTPESYGRVTGVPGAFDRCMRGIKLLIEAGIPLRLKTMAMTISKDELPAMYDLAAELGVPFRHDGMVWKPFHDQPVDDLRLSPTEIVALDYLYETAHEDLTHAYNRHKKIVESGAGYVPERLYNCGAGYRTFHIDPYGQLGLCQAVRPPVFDLLSGSFEEGWEALGEVREQLRARKNFPCMHCDVAGLCRRCAARSIQEHGEAETVVEFACEVAHLRAKYIGVPDHRAYGMELSESH
jgi:radical SAM protein with 4Fe4S-binding SPASM domain